MNPSLPETRKQRHFRHFTVSFPSEKIIQVTLTRPEKLNCIDQRTGREVAAIWEELDQDENLSVGIITGTGRAFCTGADLEEWNRMNEAGVTNDMAAPGLAGLPRRGGKKPVIAAVNGLALGGGFEMVANCDLVVATSRAVFALPEVKRGIVPVAGCLPRLARTLGLQRTMDLVLTGRNVEASTLHGWGLVTHLVDPSDDVVGEAVQLAKQICQNSPDALLVGRLGVRSFWDASGVEDEVTRVEKDWYPRLVHGANFHEGIRAFAEKRSPVWVASKL